MAEGVHWEFGHLVIDWSLGFGHWVFLKMPVREPFSPATFLTLLLICGVSLAMFMVLVRRWTSQRQWTTLTEWAKVRRFRIVPRARSKVVGTLGALLKNPVEVVLELHSDVAVIAQLQSGADRWNVFIRKSPVQRKAAALRPTGAAVTFLDQLNLEPYPSLALGHRYTLLGSSSSAARALADSSARTLIPQDIGLLVVNEWIALDFSARHFDPIELDRMLALAQQLSQLT
jgi:hypothetical protein